MHPDYLARLVAKSLDASLVLTFLSAGHLLRLWWAGELYGVSGLVFCCWFLFASATQIFGWFAIASAGQITLWIVGLVAQALLAIVLVLRKQLTDI